MIQRQDHLGKIASALKALSEACRVPVIITNQVTTKIKKLTGQCCSVQDGTYGVIVLIHIGPW
jgi:hypothetical protein